MTRTILQSLRILRQISRALSAQCGAAMSPVSKSLRTSAKYHPAVSPLARNLLMINVSAAVKKQINFCIGARRTKKIVMGYFQGELAKKCI